jgi:iron complex transport system substrate-binding protein
MKKSISIIIALIMVLSSFSFAFADDQAYVVKRGDTLTKIGKTHGISYTEIAKKNNIKNPNLIFVGQKLVIPKKPAAGATKPPAGTTNPPSVTTTPPVSSKIEIKDVVGRTIILDKPASGILGTHNPSLNTGIVLGGGDKYIKGFGNKNMANNLYESVMKDYAGIVQIGKGSNINWETVAKLKDNTIAIIPERFKSQAEEYEKVGVKAIVALPNSESFTTIRESLTIVGKALGEEKKAEQINTFINKSINETKTAAGKTTNRPSVMFLGSSNPLSVATTEMIQADIIEMVGGKNAVVGMNVKGEFADVSIEQIIAWNPEVIWIPEYAGYTVESLLNDVKWSSIKAVKNKAVYKFPSALEPWDYPTSSASLGLYWGLYNLHPEVFTKADLLKKTDEYYQLVYGKKFTEKQMGL